MKLALAGLVLFGITVSLHAQTLEPTGNVLLPSCKAFIDGKPYIEGQPNHSACFGMILGIGDLQPRIFCPPPNVTSTEWAKVIVAYMEARPERLHEDFKTLALDALQDAWPCRNSSPYSN
jgi:Rap1a immunity proteins